MADPPKVVVRREREFPQRVRRVEIDGVEVPWVRSVRVEREEADATRITIEVVGEYEEEDA